MRAAYPSKRLSTAGSIALPVSSAGTWIFSKAPEAMLSCTCFVMVYPIRFSTSASFVPVNPEALAKVWNQCDPESPPMAKGRG